MSTTTTPVHLSTLTFIRNWLDQLLETIPDDQWLMQPVPNANHTLWIVGHLAWCDDTFQADLGGPAPAKLSAWKEMFGYGTQPSARASDYPSIGEMKAAYRSARETLVSWLETLDDAKLAEPTPEAWRGFGPTYGAIINAIAAHEGTHLGQITVIRKALGMAPVMM